MQQSSPGRLFLLLLCKKDMGSHSQYMKPTQTATRAPLMLAISLLPDALALVELAEAADPVAVPDAVPVAVAVAVPVCCVSPRDGRATSPWTSQPPEVEAGQAGGVRVGE